MHVLSPQCCSCILTGCILLIVRLAGNRTNQKVLRLKWRRLKPSRYSMCERRACVCVCTCVLLGFSCVCQSIQLRYSHPCLSFSQDSLLTHRELSASNDSLSDNKKVKSQFSHYSTEQCFCSAFRLFSVFSVFNNIVFHILFVFQSSGFLKEIKKIFRPLRSAAQVLYM